MHTISACAGHEERPKLRFSPERLQPPQIAVLRLLVDRRVRPHRRRDPGARQQLSALHRTAIEIQLTECCEIARRQPESTAGHRGPRRRQLPLSIPYGKRAEEELGCEIGNGYFGGPFEHCPECHDAGRAVTETAAVRRFRWWQHPRRKAPNRQVEKELRPVLDEIHPFLVP